MVGDNFEISLSKMAKNYFYYPQCLDIFSNFLILNGKKYLNYPPWLDFFSNFSHQKNALYYPPLLEKSFEIYSTKLAKDVYIIQNGWRQL